MDVTTGYGYLTEIATGHILVKYVLQPGYYDLDPAYSQTEVADQAALDLITLWQPTPAPDPRIPDLEACITVADLIDWIKTYSA